MLKDTLVIRVEDPQGYGLYSGHKCNYAQGTMNDSRSHPSPYYDNKLREVYSQKDFSEKFKFGFASLCQLERWFSDHKWRQGVHSNGYTCKVFYAKGIDGETQSIYLSGSRQKNLLEFTLVDPFPWGPIKQLRNDLRVMTYGNPDPTLDVNYYHEGLR